MKTLEEKFKDISKKYLDNITKIWYSIYVEWVM